MPQPLDLSARDTVLFVGDSITDCGRLDDPDRLGGGYVRDVQRWLLARSPGDTPAVLNRGVSGNTSRHLSERWDDDIIAAAPSVVTVMIGVNDVWRQFDKKDEPVMVGDYAAILDMLLTRTAEKLPGVTLVVAEPTPIDPPQDVGANGVMSSYVEAARRLAATHSPLPAVPMNVAVREATDARPDVAWTTDGVHPTPAGHVLLARTWLEHTGLL